MQGESDIAPAVVNGVVFVGANDDYVYALNAANASTAAFVAGGVLVAAGMVIWLVAPSGGANRSLGAAPVVTAGGGGMLLTGRW